MVTRIVALDVSQPVSIAAVGGHVFLHTRGMSGMCSLWIN